MTFYFVAHYKANIKQICVHTCAWIWLYLGLQIVIYVDVTVFMCMYVITFFPLCSVLMILFLLNQLDILIKQFCNCNYVYNYTYGIFIVIYKGV